MSYKTTHRFQFDGDFIAFSKLKKGIPKTLLLQCDGVVSELKIAKPLRSGIRSQLQPGSRIRVRGKEKRRYHRSPKKAQSPKVKRKALAIIPLEKGHKAASTIRRSSTPMDRQVVVEVCTKANCWKRGGKQIWDRLKEIQAERGPDSLSLQPVHCMDRCKKGPCLRCPPKGKIQCQMDAKQACHLLDPALSPANATHSPSNREAPSPLAA